MILKVIGRGVSEQRIAKALNVNVKSIRAKRDLLNGICPEVAALLKDKVCPINSFQALKKVKALRQYEITKTMIGIDNYSVAYARTLVAASSPDQLVSPGKPKAHRRISDEQMEEIERELANLQGEVNRIEETFAADHLNLLLAALVSPISAAQRRGRPLSQELSRGASATVSGDLRSHDAGIGGRRIARRRPAPKGRFVCHAEAMTGLDGDPDPVELQQNRAQLGNDRYRQGLVAADLDEVRQCPLFLGHA